MLKVMEKQHYALIEKEGCNSLEITSTTVYTKKKSSRNGQERADLVRAELEEIYQTYADIYPNPKLLEENRKRDTLLQAKRAAFTSKQETIKVNNEKVSQRSFFAFLFGSTGNAETGTEDSTNSNVITSEENDDDRTKYAETSNEHDDGSLCGTLQSLDVSCIPCEVYSVVRSHLSSTLMRRENPNALRWGPRSRLLTLRQTDLTSSVIFVVVGLGEIAEFGGDSKSIPSSSSSQILHTSDREKLLGYAERTEQFDLSTVRGTILSQNSIAISWGFLDGITVIYRRQTLLSNYNKDETTAEGWRAVWWIGPSEPILENFANAGKELFHDDAGQPGSPLLKISDCVALHVEAPFTSREDQPIQQEVPIVATLVVSRLGGYIELVPLPFSIWHGPIFERDVESSARTHDLTQQQPCHYTAGQNMLCPSNIMALTTFNYQLDVQKLEIYRTKVNSKTVWNKNEYPDGPPAEFLLVASGMSADGGYGDTITFWAISILFRSSEELSRSHTSSSHGGIDFQTHARLMEAIRTDTGAPVSTFATPEIMNRWRFPLDVELNDTNASNKAMKGINRFSRQLTPVKTLSTTAPIVSMEFSDRDRSSLITSGSGPFLSILDWNGGVQIFDCSVIARLAAQELTQHENVQYRGIQTDSNKEQSQMTFHLVKCVVLRPEIANSLRKIVKTPTVGNLHWLESTDVGMGGMLPSIVFILSRSKKLVVLTHNLLEDNTTKRNIQEPLSLSMISVPLALSNAAIERFSDNCLSFVSLRICKTESSPRSTKHVLKYFVMEQLQPVAIVKTLAQESKFEEAIKSANELSKHEQRELAQVVVSCHRRLWETKGDINSLIDTDDELYILEEVMLICESERKKNEFLLVDLRMLLKMTLQLVSNHEDKKERVRKAFVRLGTFELLSKYYDSKPLVKEFKKEFLDFNIIDISVELARQGDIPALSIVLFRHRFEVKKKLLDILRCLPLAIKSSSYCHLLPTIRNNSVTDLFLDSTNEEIIELPWSHMPQYVFGKYLVSIVFDRFDEMVVLEYNKTSKDGVDVWKPMLVLIADWFLKRAKQMQSFVGNVDDVVNFTVLGLKCLSAYTAAGKLDSEIPGVQDLYMTWRIALSLKRVLTDRSVSIDGVGIDTDDLMGMNLVELLGLVLGYNVQSSIVRYRFDNYIQPIVLEIFKPRSNDNLDEALATYCLKEVRRCSGLQASEAKHALAYTVAIAEISKASLRKKIRLIKNEHILTLMVFSVVREISMNFDEVEISLVDTREILESMWKLFETLPANMVTPDSKNEMKIQKFYDDLVGTDIFSRWPRCNPFNFYNKRQSKDEENAVEKGKCDVLMICDSFIATVTILSNFQDQASLLQDLLYDLHSLNKIVFKNSLDLSTILCKYLISSLLEKGCFGLVACCLRSDEMTSDRNQVIDNIIEYVDEAMFSNGNNMNRITDAITCQDTLEPLLPEIQPFFQSNRRYLDASHFISTVLLDEKLVTPLKPLDLMEMPALDVLETILQEFPECIGCRCPQWLDFEYAQDSNKLLRQAETLMNASMEGRENVDLPDLPGGAVFHLATILGLESNVSALAVKARVIHYALQNGHYGAGAAIARTLVQEKDFDSSADMAVDLIKIRAIADVVSIESYLDFVTRKELCESVLRRFRKKYLIADTESFNIILQVSSNLDHITSRFDKKVGIFTLKRKEYLLSRPIARLHNHTLNEYSRDVHSLFIDFGKQSSEGFVHDSLLDVLSRFIFYWCIHDSITTKSVVDLRHKADVEENLNLGCALILQISCNVTVENSVRELHEIALTQPGRVSAEERFETSNKFILPNLDISRHLIERGFAEKTAHRASAMTGNAGYDEAMAWAIEHSMDPDLNNPLLVLKSSNKQMVDGGSIQVLQKSLAHLSEIVENPFSRSVFLHNLTSSARNYLNAEFFPRTTDANIKSKSTTMEMNHAQNVILKPKRQKLLKKTTENALKLPEKSHLSEGREIDKPTAASLEKNAKDKQVPQQQPPPTLHPQARSPSNLITKSTDKGHTDGTLIVKSKMNRTSSIVNSTRTIAQNEATTKATIDREDLKCKGKLALENLKLGEDRTLTETTKIRAEASLDQKVETAKRSVIDREELRRRGQMALSKLRNTQNEPGSRRRLIEEGRQFLKQSKISPRGRLLAPDRTMPSIQISQSGSFSLKDPSPIPPSNSRLQLAFKPHVSDHFGNEIQIIAPEFQETNTVKAINFDTDKDDSGWDFDDFDSF